MTSYHAGGLGSQTCIAKKDWLKAILERQLHLFGREITLGTNQHAESGVFYVRIVANGTDSITQQYPFAFLIAMCYEFIIG